MKIRLLLSVLLFAGMLCSSQLAQAQSQEDLDLAEAYYKNNEFDKAVALYDKIFSKRTNDIRLYNKYLTVLKSLKQYDKAEKLIKKQIKLYPEEPALLFDLSQLYLSTGNGKKSDDQKALMLKNIDRADDVLIRKTAKLFVEYGMLEDALAIYQKGNKLFNDENQYAYEIGAIYGKQGKMGELFQMMIRVLDNNPDRLQETKNVLQNYISNDQSMMDLQSILYKKIQKNPSNLLYPDVLIWSYLQRKDFESALEQVIALDHRLDEEGIRVLEVGRLAAEEKDYDASIKAFQYLLSKGIQANNYFIAQNALLSVRKLKITTTDAYTLNDLKALKIAYLKAISDFETYNRRNELVESNRALAELEALYFNEVDTAIVILKTILKDNPLEIHVASRIKLDLGDYYLLSGEPWEATLLYSQVDKALPGEDLSEMGKFKNAKWSYFFGDFEWAQAQMDVLKSSTSDVIANDALDLSIFISENLGSGADSIMNINAMKLFAKAELFEFQHKTDSALALYDTIQLFYKENNLADNVVFAKAQIAIRQKKYEVAIQLLDEINTKWSEDILGDDALFAKADLFETKLNKKKEAMDLYSDLLLKFPGSTFAVEARKRFRSLRGDHLSE